MAAKDSSDKKPARSPGAKGTPSKAEFVRSLPPGTSFAQAEELAKQKGIALTRGYFYVLRSEQNKGAKQPRTPREKAARAERRGATGLRLTSDDPHEAQLLEAVRVLGVTRARALVDAVEKLEGPG